MFRKCALLFRPLFCLGLWVFLATAGAVCAENGLANSKVTLRLPSGPVHAEVFEPVDRRNRPVVLVLHGAGGTLLDGSEMRRVARHLAAEGNAVYVLHYFERTGTVFALNSSMKRHFRTWLQTVREAIPAIQGLRADRSPVGLYGYSLGGFLALFAASDNPRVAAVVEHAGGVWDGKMDRIGRMPAVLMVHGERDARVPFAQYAKPLVRVLRKRAATVETEFFSGEGHVFTPAAMTKVRAAAAKFFRTRVGGRARETAARGRAGSRVRAPARP
ncbi:MAG: dienelactone hydrolase family protein [Chthoniobacterales bacterium]